MSGIDSLMAAPESAVAVGTSQDCLPCWVQGLFEFLRIILVWPSAVLALGTLCIILFRDELRNKIPFLERVGRDGIVFKDSVNTDLTLQSVKPSTDLSAIPSSLGEEGRLITPAFVASVLRESGEFEDRDIERYTTPAYHSFLARHITTEDRLLKLLHSQMVIATLSEMCVRILRRNPKKPLDPIVFATYAPALFLSNLHSAVVQAVEMDMRSSLEYQKQERKHRDL